MPGLWSFVVMVGLLTLTPGMDTALILRTAAVASPRRAWGVVLGIQTGTLCWGVLTSAGVTAILTASHLAYEVLRWAGAAYLIWLGLRLLAGARRGVESAPAAGEPAAGSFLRGLLTNLLNPKVGAFYVALLPQFVPAGAPAFAYGVLLAGVHVGLGLLWSTVLVSLAQRFRAVLRRPMVRRVLDRVTGTVLAGFGIRLALTGH